MKKNFLSLMLVISAISSQSFARESKSVITFGGNSASALSQFISNTVGGARATLVVDCNSSVCVIPTYPGEHIALSKTTSATLKQQLSPSVGGAVNALCDASVCSLSVNSYY